MITYFLKLDEMNDSENLITNVPKQVFDRFVDALVKEDVPADVVGRLKKTLNEQKDISEAAIRRSLFAEDNTEV